MTLYLAALAVDALGTAALAVVALHAGSPPLLGLSLIAAAGLLFAVLGLDRSPSGRRTGVVVAGFALNTVGCVSVVVAETAVGRADARTAVVAVALLLAGNAVSAVYARALTRPGAYAR